MEVLFVTCAPKVWILMMLIMMKGITVLVDFNDFNDVNYDEGNHRVGGF